MIKENKYYLIYAKRMFDEPKYYVGKAKFCDNEFEHFDCGDDWVWTEDVIAVKDIEEITSWDFK